MRTLDRLLSVAVAFAATLGASLVLLIVAFLLRESATAIRELGLLRFATDDGWHPLSGSFGMAPMALGSALVAGGAIALAAPLGILAGVFTTFYAPRPLAGAFKRVIELLAGTPSVVFGFWGLVVLAPMVGRYEPPGTGLFTGVLVLALMVLPTITITTTASLAAVPEQVLRAADALALSRWTTVSKVAVPAAASGIFTGVILGLGRAIGETMAVLMVCGNVVQVPSSAFDPVRALTANIALEMAYAMDLHRSALFVSGLLLVAVVTLLVLTASWVQGRGAGHA